MLQERYYLEIDESYRSVCLRDKPDSVFLWMRKSHDTFDIARFIFEDIGPNVGWILNLIYQISASTRKTLDQPKVFRLKSVRDGREINLVELQGYSANEIKKILSVLR